jgi:hypothetical protein
VALSDDAEPLGVDDIHVVRTFLVSATGELCSTSGATVWNAGWNTAACRRDSSHETPDPDCACGFYGVADPAYAPDDCRGEQVWAIVASHGVMQQGSRGVRMRRARIDAVCLGRRISPAVQAQVHARYPGVAIVDDRERMLASYPPARLDGFRRPWITVRARRIVHLVFGVYALLTLGFLCTPGSVVGSPSWWLDLKAAALALVFVVGLIEQIRIAPGTYLPLPRRGRGDSAVPGARTPPDGTSTHAGGENINP